MTFLKPAAFVLALTAVGVTPVLAQEQENPSTPGQIPDPSTYQGSTVLQQQSDQQDQQYRQQQQQPAYQQPMQSYSGAQRQGGSASDPYPLCIKQLAASPRFAPLAGKISLGSTDPQAIQLFDNHSRPTATEKILIMRWAEGKRHCQAIGISNFRKPTPREWLAYNRWGFPALLSLIHQLVAGQLTYGQFNYRRAMNQLSSDHYLAANR
ncbi:MAG TPA: hypothetical protein VM912_15140 [Terriglobales bacterium]|nr:hypothetical protein [Terriglobales bacterium]